MFHRRRLPSAPGSRASGRRASGNRERLRRFLAPIVLATVGVMFVVAASPFWVIAGESSEAQVNESLPAGAMQAKATTACLECHEARIILQQRLSKAAWTKEVDKMMKWGAVVDSNDRDALIHYLSTNFSPDQPAYEAHRTATGTTQKNAGKVSK